MTHYQQLQFTCSDQQAQPLSDWLAEQPQTLAVSLLDAADTPIYEPRLDHITLWDNVVVEALFDATTAIEPILLALNTHFGRLPPYRLQNLAERDWVSENQAQFPPQCFAQRLWLYPSWQAIPAEHRPVLRLSPGLAFGTGTHPTTRLCLQWLAEHIHDAATLIDYGCGSGILGLAALVLGASHVTGVDLDPQALEASRANTELNALPLSDFSLCLPQALQVENPVDIVIANILATPLIELAPRLCSYLKPGGALVLSGILREQMSAVIDAYRPYLKLTCFGENEDWCALVGHVPQ